MHALRLLALGMVFLLLLGRIASMKSNKPLINYRVAWSNGHRRRIRIDFWNRKITTK